MEPNARLASPMALGSPERPMPLYCRFCTQPFTSQSRLETHERIHTGKKAHQCPRCGRAFSQAMYLRFHMQQIHGSSLDEVESTIESASMMHSATVLDALVMAQNTSSNFSDDPGETLESLDDVGDIMDFAPLFHAEDLPLSFNEGREPDKACLVNGTSGDQRPHFVPPAELPDPVEEDGASQEGPSPRKIRKQQTPQRNLPEPDMVPAFLDTSDSILYEGLQSEQLRDELEENNHQESSLDDPDSNSPVQMFIHRPSSSCDIPTISSNAQTESVGGSETNLADHSMEPHNTVKISFQPPIKVEPSWTPDAASEIKKEGSPELHSPNQRRYFTSVEPRMVQRDTGRKRMLQCELCPMTFTGKLFLRSHFRVVHGAEIIGIDSDDEDPSMRPNLSAGYDRISTLQTDYVSQDNRRQRILMIGEGTGKVKRGRGRPRGSRSKDDLSLNQAINGQIKRGRGRPKGSISRAKTDQVVNLNSPLAQDLGEATGLVKRGRGRPKGSKSKSYGVDRKPTLGQLVELNSQDLEKSKNRRERPNGSKSYGVDTQPPLGHHVEMSVQELEKGKRGRGRPKGSKSKRQEVQPSLGDLVEMTGKDLEKVTRGRGRPKGSKSKLVIPNVRIDATVGVKQNIKRGRGRPLGSKSKFANRDLTKKLIIIKFVGSVPEKSKSKASIDTHKEGMNPKVIKAEIENRDHSNNIRNTALSLSPAVLSTLSETAGNQNASNEALEQFIDKETHAEVGMGDAAPNADVKPNLIDLTCDICNKTLARKSDMARHMRTHTGEKPYPCTVCDKRFGDRSHLRDHLKLHTGRREYVCKVCGMAFAQSNGLMSHSMIHVEKQYGCKVCSKKFTRKSDVQRHLRLHAGLKPVACHICQKKFANSSNLNSHLKVHREPQFGCEGCQKMFARRSDLNRHKQTTLHAKVSSY